MPPTTSPTRTLRYLANPGEASAGHEHISRLCMARRLADVLGLPFGGEWDGTPPSAPLYVVPGRTLSTAQAAACGIHGIGDLFGGVVPHEFAGTKIITHGLLHEDAPAPPGWCSAFADAVRGVVLRGYSVFSLADLQLATSELLRHGRLRLKHPGGMGGQGQQVIGNEGELVAFVDGVQEESLGREGLVVEQDLTEVVTFSIGQVWLGGLCMSYCGSQHSTRDNRGASVYGGSELHCVRGDFDALGQLDSGPGMRLAIEQARTYHQAAQRCFPDIILSRANYDVAQGRDAQGHPRSGVLEQSWRIGGASAAEIEAAAILLQQPARQTVRASTVELYGPGATAPPGAHVLFHGDDPHSGPLLKYAQVITHAGT